MNGERIEKTRAWSIPVLLALIAALLTTMGTLSIRALDRMEGSIGMMRVEFNSGLQRVVDQVRIERDTNLKQDGEINALQVRRGP